MAIRTLEQIARVSFQRLISIGVWALGFTLVLDFAKEWVTTTLAIRPVIIGLILIGISSYFIIQEDRRESNE